MKTVLVTGGSGGIGLALAKLYAADGYKVVLCAQNEDKLQAVAAELPNAELHAYVVQDLSVVGAAKQLVQQLTDRGIAIDILVNNAGFGTSGEFIKTDPERESQEILLNVMTLTQLTKLLLPRMVTAGSGHVLNVASIAAFMPGPYMAVYYATKAYVLRFSEGLHEELRGTGVGVTALCPGPTATGFAAAAGTNGKGAFKGRLLTTEYIAQAAYDGFKQGKMLVVPGWKFKVLRFALRFLPDGVAAKYVGRVQRP